MHLTPLCPCAPVRCTAGLALALIAVAAPAISAQTANDPGIVEPALTATTGQEVRIPNTDQVASGTQLNLVNSTETDADQAMSMMGHAITQVSSPNDDMADALQALSDAAGNSNGAAMHSAAEELMAILTGTTQGRIYDGFAMLNYNRGAFAPDHVPGEYKMKELQDSGLTAPGIDGQPRKIWEVTVNMLWYDGQFDSDTFLLRIPVEADPFDTLRVHYRIYSLETEDFAPTTVLLDHRLAGSVQFPFKGLDSVWERVSNDTLTEITVDHPPLRMVRGIYTWGWRVHPPRIQFLQPVYEMVNAHTGKVELEPQGRSFTFRNRQLSIDTISDAAPEKKMYIAAQAALNGEPASVVSAMLSNPGTDPRGTWQDWADLAENQRQLPPEAWDMLAGEGVTPGNFGPYRFVSVYMNGEMYGDGPDNSRIAGWQQGDRFQVKLINLDQYTHYFRNVDFGPRLHDDIASNLSSGSHSFEIMNFKPFYGAPKVAEVQWRAGWGFRPHFDVIQQQDVFSRSADQALLQPFTDGDGETHEGWLYSAFMRGGDFRFNPPNFIIESPDHPSAQRLRDQDGQDGLIIGQTTEGYGVAKMCSHDDHPLGGFCENDISAFNPHGVRNVDTDGDGTPDVLWFPPFLRNPNADGGDIIPPTPAWKPFLWINPNNGTLFIDPADPSQGFWADRTYSHGRPVYAGDMITATIEAPRASAQVFYQFDDCFHDNAIFSPHPTFAPDTAPAIEDINEDGTVNVLDLFQLLAAWGPCGLDCPEDLNRDGVVDVFDLMRLLANWS